ncbi:jg26064, partial [Pararge aegeria aegeria]
QDYETPGMQLYMLDISVPGETLVGRVTLQIVNIDDNAPVIRLLDSCVVPVSISGYPVRLAWAADIFLPAKKKIFYHLSQFYQPPEYWNNIRVMQYKILKWCWNPPLWHR